MISTNRWHWLLFITIIIHFSLVLLLGFSRYWGYMSSINDLGHYDQAVWGCMRYQPFLNTSCINQQINFLGVHFNPVIFLFVPFYVMFTNVIWLTETRKDCLTMLDSHLQMDRVDYIRSIRSMLSDKKYGILLWDDPWLVLSRRASNCDFNQKIKQKLDKLGKEWKIDF